jgi:uncharacterized protein (DUF362 family)
MSKGFVRIKALAESSSQWEDLSKIYDDRERLILEISEITNPEINISSISGKKVLLKPNWVQHPKRETDILCLCTHHNFILAFAEVVLKLKPVLLTIADAPVQSCRWDLCVDQTFLQEIDALKNKYQIPITVKDLRRVVMHLHDQNKVTEQNQMDDYLIFDVGKKSYLEPVTHPTKNTFRVTHYNPDRFLESHSAGMHKYCITKELFEADVVISMPKAKTHEKTGITNALKNIVGLNGDKDFLPHHRLGSAKEGGDAYPEHNWVRSLSERIYDQANKRIGKKFYFTLVRIAALFWRLSLPKSTDRLGAGWHGNDTTWRMVMDLNMIVNYGKKDGTLDPNVQRKFYSLCDGIIGGQKDGPLTPTPLNLGMICFTNDSAWCDIAMATLMSMEVTKLPLLMAAKDFSTHQNINIQYNGKTVNLEELKKRKVPCIMPSGWINYNQ